MGTPLFLAQNGISERVETYYGMAMGGAAVNGIDRGHIGLIDAGNVLTPVFTPKANLTITYSNVTETSADVTVTIDAVNDIPAGVVLQVVTTERTVTWSELIGEPTSPNGQTVMHDVVCALLGDTLGNDVTPLTAGSSDSYTFPMTVTENQNPDSLQVTALLQYESVKVFLAAEKNEESPFGATPILESFSVQANNSFVAQVQNGSLTLVSPFTGGIAEVFDVSGRLIETYDLSAHMVGDVINLEHQIALGIHFLKVTSPEGISAVTKLSVQ